MSNTYTIASTTQPNYNTGAVGSSYTYTTNGTGYDAVPNLTITNDPASMTVKGSIILNGKDLEERLKTIEDLLQIPEKDIKLEQEHPKLKKLYDDYINALKKYKMWQTLKENNDAR